MILLFFLDNDFEIFIDPDASTHYYKEMEINAINTLWDLMLNVPYMNGGQANNSWESYMKKAVYVNGKVNDVNANNRFWTVELAIPFVNLIQQTIFATAPPKKNDQWRINFSRVEWKVRIVNGHYEKIPGIPEDNWVWAPQTFLDWPGGLNMHIPERWGIIQFSKGPINQTNFIRPDDWDVRIVLAEMYYAMSKFTAVNGYYTDSIHELDIPQFVIKGYCVKVPVINSWRWGYNITVYSLDSSLQGFIDNLRFTQVYRN